MNDHELNFLGLTLAPAFCRVCGSPLGEIPSVNSEPLLLICDACLNQSKVKDCTLTARDLAELKEVYQVSGIPESFLKWDKNLGNNNLLEQAGRFSMGSLYLVGPTGHCKSRVLAIGAAKKIRTARQNGHKFTVCFEQTSKLLLELRALAEKSSKALDKRINELIHCDLLILDDFGAKENESSFAVDKLFVVLDSRYSYGRRIWLSSNYSLAKLADRLADERAIPIIRRITEMCEVISSVGVATCI